MVPDEDHEEDHQQKQHQKQSDDIHHKELLQREQIASNLGFPNLGYLSRLTLLWNSCFDAIQQKSVIVKILGQLQRQFVQNVFGVSDKDDDELASVVDIYSYLEDNVKFLKNSSDMLKRPNDELEQTYGLISDYFMYSPKSVLPSTAPKSKVYKTIIQMWSGEIQGRLTVEDQNDLENIAKFFPLL
ncbi:hypothetical protein RFI_28118, partial [Reticulomyxa filosa]